MDRWAAIERGRPVGEEGQAETVMIPVDLDGYVRTARHPYGQKIGGRKIINAQGWAGDHAAHLIDQTGYHRSTPELETARRYLIDRDRP